MQDNDSTLKDYNQKSVTKIHNALLNILIEGQQNCIISNAINPNAIAHLFHTCVMGTIYEWLIGEEVDFETHLYNNVKCIIQLIKP